MYRLIVAFSFGIVLLLTGALAFAPYLPRALQEGSPSLFWHEVGNYAEVEGASDASAFAFRGDHPLGPDLQELFDTSGGAALLVAHQGRLELEHYAEDADADTRFNSFSMVKSLVGGLVYKAISEGVLNGLDQTLGEVLPEAVGLGDLTLGRLLTMRAGVHFDRTTSSFGGPGSIKDSDTFPNPFGPLARLHFQGVESIIGGLTADEEASDELNYQNVNTALLGAVLERAYGKRLEELLSSKIWKPAGAADALWRRSGEEGRVSAYCCLYATARDWVRVGMFLAQNGTPSEPFLPVELWRDFLGLDVPLSERQDDHYGNHTIQNVLDREGEALQGPFTYFMGQNGQILYIMPQHDLVVYRAGEGYQLLHSTLYGAWNSIR